ncbi:uncharacterized protein LOC141706032 [Apium graveolens]|uniref:uncharacterized protein LOC141706032 n=1 Tax=Apium graveolens TaxID=4045 RepID=UPI003D7B4BE2
MVLTLSAKNKLGFVDGSIVAPDATADEFKFWERCNNLMISWLLANLDDAIAKSVLFFHTAAEIWQDLDERYGFSSMAQVYSLEQQLLEINQGTVSVSEFFTKIKTLWDCINDANPFPYCTFRGNVLMMQPLPSIAQTYRLFAQEERHKEISSVTSQTESLAFYADRRRFNPQYQGNKIYSTTTSGSNANWQSQRNDQNFLSGQWIIDSGSTDHICPNIDQFTTYKVVTETDNTITIPDGKKIRVFHIGIVKLNDEIILKDVLHVPDFQFKLISVAKLCKDFSCQVMFTDEKCFIQGHFLKGPQIQLGSLSNGLYTVPHSAPLLDVKRCNAIISKNLEEAKLWHLRMRHLPFSQLKMIVPSSSVQNCLDSIVCQICPAARQVRKPFPIIHVKSTKIFQLLHIDVWGPYKTKSLTGCTQFVTIVDDFSRFTWVHLIKHKTEVYSVLHSFLNYVENHFHATVQYIRSDNALELSAGNCAQLYRDKGIVHQTTCVYTPQQNGVVERKHRHLLETSRSIFLQAHLPPKFWGDSIMPDISYTVQLLSQFLQSPRTAHYAALNHTLRYLSFTAGQGIKLQNPDRLILQAFSDSDWASCPDSRRSVTGYVLLLGGSPVTWKSKKQPTVSRSSSEAEYRAMAAATSEVTWVVQLLQELGVNHLSPVTLFCDYQSALHIAKNPVFHERTKHIEVDCHFTRDKVLEGLLQLSY